ncbi:DUF927 domain-containing protein [Staphylococcus sp. Marseille-Q5304]|uniref:DUF927 domain-containing protein n=1 Tax=Staphylococcus sp. Marseille-Q5304 TaxID=2942200 RepID=UPI0020734896|nr:DUF927 domain-containing protein [Staphylococcus sp. Marseille-Q5304]
MSELSKEDILKNIEETEKKETQNIIPKGYMLEPHQYGTALYKIIPSKKVDKPDKKIFITNTIPEITERYEDIESNEVSYNLKFYDGKTPVNLGVSGEQISDSRQLLKLSNYKLDVTTTTMAYLVEYINEYKRYNPPIKIKVSTRLGHIKSYFIYPYKEELKNFDVKLHTNDRGYQKIINAFESKGTLNDYANKVFSKIKHLPMVMVMLYASLGSVLVREFGLQPFITEISGRTSTGKTFTLNLVSSVWGKTDLVTTWDSTKNSIMALATFLNSFPMPKDDTRNTSEKNVIDTAYTFSSGESKSRSNRNLTINEQTYWHNIMLSTGEVSITDIGKGKGGVSARVVTLQDKPYPEDFDFITLDEAFRENYGTLGKAFIKQYQSNKEGYKQAFKSARRYYNAKSSNEVMQRLGSAFALLQTTGEILNDIDGFEHEHFKIMDEAYNSMMKNNSNIDNSKLRLEEILQYLDANRNSIEGDGYPNVKYGDVKAIYKRDYLSIMTETVSEKLKYEKKTVMESWNEKGYLITDKNRLQKQVKHNNKRYLGYAIKQDVIKELGFDFSNSHNPYSEY